MATAETPWAAAVTWTVRPMHSIASGRCVSGDPGLTATSTSLRFVQGEVSEVEAWRHHAADQHLFAGGRTGGLPVAARNQVLRDLAALEAGP
jgi:hypothetical protein